MKRDLAVKVAVAALALVGAAWFLSSKRTASPERERGQPMLPGLESRAEEVGAVEVLRGNATVRLERQPNGSWAIATNDSYPARGELVRAMLVSLAGLTVDDRMTAKKDRHGELGLAWPDAEGKARLVRFLSAKPDAEPVAELVVGDERFSPDAVFVRLPSQDQSWRALGRVQVPADAMAWMDRAMVSLPAGETTAVAFDGLTVTAPPQPEPAAPGPRPTFVPTVTDAAKALWTDGQIDQAKTALPSFLERLEFDGVRRARDGGGDPKWSVTFETKSATVALTGREDSDGVWFSLSALPRPGFVPSEPPKYPGDPHVPDWTKLDQRFAGWEFKMPSWKADSLRRLRAKEAPAASAEPDSAPTGLPGLTPAR